MTIVERRRFFKAKDKYTKEWDVHFLPDIFKFGVEDADTDTICYATGITDAKGAAVYEHDIVMFRGEQCEITFSEVNFRFEITFIEHSGPTRGYVPLHISHTAELEVIGNIFDL